VVVFHNFGGQSGVDASEPIVSGWLKKYQMSRIFRAAWTPRLVYIALMPPIVALQIPLLEVPPGATVARHVHQGEEVVYEIEGGTLEQPDGKLVVFEAGAAIIYSGDVPHAGAKVLGDKPLKMLNVFIVDKGKPVTELV